MPIRTSTWINNSVGIERGPLAFALRIKEQWRRAKDLLHDFDEYEVLPQSPWNYALQIDRNASNIEVQTRAVSDVPFDTDAAPIVLTAPAKRLPSWGKRTVPGEVVFGKANNNWQQIERVSVSKPLEPDLPHRLRVEANGDHFRIFVDDMDRPRIDQKDSTFASGSVGLRVYECNATFDHVTLDGKPIVDWKQLGGEWNKADGKIAAKSARDGKAVAPSLDDCRGFTLEATITASAGGDAGVIFRVHDATEKLDGYRGYYVGLSARKGQSMDPQEPPQSPVRSSEPLEQVELIPFGSAKLRVSYFPVLAPK
jgi:hypothetical protein